MKETHMVSTLVLLLLAAGVYFRRRPKVHMKLMCSVFVCDLLVVLYIEITRHAVEKMVTATGALLWFHVTVSVLVLVGYVVQIVLGRRLLKGEKASKSTHMKVGITFCSLRILNYVTSFMI